MTLSGDDLAQMMSEVHIKLEVPTFTPKKVKAWFVLLETFFTLANVVADCIKWAYVVTSLDEQYIAVIEPLILNPPEEDRYGAAKALLFKFEDDENERKLEETLRTEEIGDRTPSQFLRRLREIAPEATIATIREIWLSSFPECFGKLLLNICSNIEDYERLGQTADHVMQFSHEMEKAAEKPSRTGDQEAVEELKKKVESLTNELSTTEMMLRKCRKIAKSAVFPQQNPFNPFFRPIVYQPFPGICFYHALFGNRAHKCTSSQCRMAPAKN